MNETLHLDGYAVVGIGCRLPGSANTPERFWKLLCDGVDAVSEIPRERFDLAEVYDADPGRAGKMYTRWGGFADDVEIFDAAFFGISPREAVRIDPQQRVLLEIVWEALEDGGLPADRLCGSNTGVFIGISTHDYSDLQVAHRDQLDSYYGTGTAMSLAANRISYAYDLRGPSIIVDTACSSSLTAVHLACRSLKTRECDLAIAGGVNIFVTPEPFIAFCKASMLSPDGRCKAFDARANGFVRGEGAGVVVLKALARAIADGDRIYAVVRGSAINQDGRSPGITVPNAEAQEALIREALRDAGVAPSAIQYVEAHGTGTRVGDPIEAAAIGRMLSPGRAAASPCLLGSVKTNIGHLEAAAGIAGLLKATLALAHGEIPPSLHFQSANPAIPFDDLRLRVVTAVEPWPANGHRRLAGVNSFGFGGANAHVVLEEPPPPGLPPARADEPRVHVLPISARHPNALRQLLHDYRAAVAGEAPPLTDLCYTAAVRRSHHAHRVCLVGSSRAELVDQIDAMLDTDEAGSLATEGRTRGEQPRLAFVFTGMGPQWWGMGRQLLASEPVFRQAIEECDARFAAVGDWSLAAALAADEAVSRVHEADLAPVANAAIQIGLVRLWASWGIVPDAIVGHSAGEIGAACAAGALGLEDALRVGFHRGRLQHRASGTGTMLSAGLSEAEAAEAIAGLADRVAIAAINSPTSVTLAGDRQALEAIAGTLERGRRFNRFLPVQVPYHGPQMEAIREEMLASLAGLAPRTPAIPLLSTVTGAWVEGATLDAGYWYDNVRRPVRFAAAVDRLIDDQVDLFVEVGPHPALSRSIVECLGARTARGTVLPTLRRMEDERGVMLRALAAMYSRGRQVDWSGVQAPGELVAAPRYPWQRERHWFQPEERQSQRRSGVDSGHPLLGHRLRSVRPIWEADFGDSRLDYLEDHVVQNSPTLPGAAYAEMAFGAARQIAPDAAAVVEDLTFRKALFLGRRSETLVQFLLEPDTSGFEIHSGPAAGQSGWTLHASGRLRTAPLESTSLAAVDLAAVRARCPDEIPVGEVYESLASRGLLYRRDFLGIASLWRGSGDALVRVALPADARAPADGSYRVHPALLDSAFQAMLAATESVPAADITARSRYLPASIKRLTLVRDPGPAFWAHAVITRADAEAIEGNVTITDEAGNVAIQVDALRCKSLDDGRAKDSTADDALYQLRWEPQPLAGRARREPSPVAASAEVGARLVQAAARLADEIGWVERQRRLEPTLDGLVVRYTRAALLALGWDGREAPAGDLADRLAVAPRHRRFFARLLEILHDCALPPAPDPSPAGELAEAVRLGDRVLSEYPENRAAVDLLRRLGERLAAILTDRADAREVLFAANAAWAGFFSEVPVYQYYNRVVADAVALALEQVPDGTAVRLLEIGAGTGGTTATVLPRLPSRAAEYVFTDVSTLFLAQARERFRDQPFVRVASLDIERDTAAQLGRETFDVIVASNVLHATADLRTTLRNVRRLLAPGGLLILFEVTRKMAWIDLIFGITDGWWRFTDTDLRPAYALMDAGRWRALLEEAGFESPASASEPDGAGPPVSAVILATAPRVAEAHATRTGASRDWLVFTDPTGVADRVVEGLRARGDRCVAVRHGEGYGRLGTGTFTMAADAAGAGELLDAVGAEDFGHHGIIHAWTIRAPLAAALAPAELIEAQQVACGSLVALVQAYESRGRPLPPTWILTAGAQPVRHGIDQPSVSQAPVWGFGRVLASEQPRLACRLVDLDAAASDDAVRALLDDLDADPGDEVEEEIAYRDGQRYVTRLRPTRLSEARTAVRKRALAPDRHQFRLEIDTPGALESLTLRQTPDPAPGPGEIVVRVLAAGLNFRDVMLALAMLPPMAIAGSGGKTGLGFECAGVVTACGAGVEEFRPGDEVLALAFGAFASHVVTRAEQAAHKPAQLSFAEAASIPLVFATAVYGLEHLARLAPGERVLIHAAAGGVGLAAVQVARCAGAEIFATAGSPEKRAYLKSLGIAHVLDSRSLAFADEIMAATGGEGVDVVLNSLAGEAIAKGLSILRPYGRFIELGKRDIHADAPIGLQPFDRSLVFASVALEKMFLDRPAILGAMLRDVMRLMADGTYAPIPRRDFDLGEAELAFRTLGQARHIGKLVLTVREPEYQVAPHTMRAVCRPDATYVISGGLGGFGLAVARWLVESGAGHVVLMSRTGAAAPENQAALDRLRELPARIVVYKGDVGREDDVRRMLAEISATLPPLRGVIHAAMVLDDVLLVQLTPERLRAVLEPKISGAWNLHRLTTADELDFFVMFSSFASIIGTKGQGNYAAANAFLDVLAPYRRSLGLPALTINWGGLSDVGYVANHQEVAQYLHHHGTEAFTSTEAVQIMEEALRLDISQLMAARLDWGRWSAIASKAFKSSKRLAHFEASAGGRVPGGAADARPLIPTLAQAAAEARPALMEGYLVERVAKVLGTSAKKVPGNLPLTQMGVDSLMAVELQTIVERDFGVQVPLDWLLEGITIGQLTTRLLERLAFGGAGEAAAEAGAAAATRAPEAPAPAISPAAAPGSAAPSAARLEPVEGPAVSADVAPASREPAPTAVSADVAPAPRERTPTSVPRVVSGPEAAASTPPPAVLEPAPVAPTSPPRRRTVDYASLDYSRWSPRQRFAKRVVSALFRIGSRVEVEGLEHIPAGGPVVLAVNHLSMLDVPLIFTLLPRRAVCLAADRLQQQRFIGGFLDIGDTIYVHRGEADRSALDHAAAVLRAGGVLGIAPEGTRSRSGGLARGRIGMVHLAAEAGAVVVPMAAYGQERIIGDLKRLRRAAVHVRIGRPLSVAQGERTAARFQSDTDRVMLAIAAMLPREYRGVYAEAADQEARAATA